VADGVSLAGDGVSLVPGTGGGGTVVAGAGIAVTSGSTVALGTIAAGDILGNPGTVGASPTAVAIGAGLTLASSGTLSATGGGSGTVTQVTVQGGPFLNGGTITSAGTVANSTASLVAHGILIAEGTSAVVATAALTNGQLLIGATGADPTPQTVSGDAAISSTGSVTVSKVAGNTLSANAGAVLNSGTVQINNAVTLAGTAAGTLAISPTTGTSDVILNMPASGGTVTAGGGPSFSRQRMLMEVKQGATAGVLNFGTAYHLSGAITSFTLTATANAIDRLQWLSPDGAGWALEAINQGATF